jgi:hypothetical protein
MFLTVVAGASGPDHGRTPASSHTMHPEDTVAINTGKVVAGGLAAGVVMNVIDFASNYFLLQDRWKAEMTALNPSLAANTEMSGSLIGFIICDFLMAILLVWTYAAIRPRFGAGPGTAMKAGLLFFLFGGVLWSTLSVIGIFSWGFFAMSGAVFLVNMLVSAYVGAMVYTEA